MCFGLSFTYNALAFVGVDLFSVFLMICVPIDNSDTRWYFQSFLYHFSPVLLKLQKGLTLRANSLRITFYGNCLAVRRRAPISLATLIELAGLFGLSSRLVRTSVFRLAANSWFDVTKLGRRSFYGLSALG